MCGARRTPSRKTTSSVSPIPGASSSGSFPPDLTGIRFYSRPLRNLWQRWLLPSWPRQRPPTRELALQLDLALPLYALEHHEVITGSIPELRALDFETPAVRDPRAPSNVRQEGSGFLCGVYEARLARLRTPSPSSA